MILYVLKKKACCPIYVRKLLLLLKKYNIYTLSVNYLYLQNGKKKFKPLKLDNDFNFNPGKSRYECVFFITNFQYCNTYSRKVKEDFREEFGHECIHASDNDWDGLNEIDLIQFPNNKILFYHTQNQRNKMQKKYGYFI